MKKTKIFFLILFLLATNCYAGILLPKGKITVKVVNSKGIPVDSAKVSLRIDTSKGPGMGWGTSTRFLRGKTNASGLYVFEDSLPKKCTVSGDKEGFYSSGNGYTFKNRTALNRWEPRNPTVLIKLKEKRNPIPMYAKRTGNIKVPVMGKTVGYDLEKGDWVFPYGNGMISDFLFICKARYTSNDDWECSYKLIFSNENDGIQDYDASKDRSSYKWPYEAPVEGYRPEVEWAAAYIRGVEEKTDKIKGKKSIFRVRTKVDDKGNIIEARYGKISGNIRLYADATIGFAYYFNPTGTRNLEYDPDQSLFKWKNRNEIYKHKISSP